jgi:cyclic pyranopterin phosphate synthase
MLTDSFDRHIEYLRVSVTDHCNYRCFYCMPKVPPDQCCRADLLGDEQLTRLIRLFSELGVHKVRLTGGEPLVRRHLAKLAGMIGALPGISDLSLSTNAHLLANFAADLKRAGIRRVNISLDSLDADNFARITQGGDLQQVLAGIAAAQQAGLTPIKLNMVVMKGINDDEIENMLDFASERALDLRFIETMPVGPAGNQSMVHYYPATAILTRLRHKFGQELIVEKGQPGAGPARCYRVGGSPVRFGVISAMSRHFCQSCNRVRLTARGDLVLCLGQQDHVSLREGLLSGRSDEELKQDILAAIAKKPAKHNFLTPGLHTTTRMSAIGG